MKGSLNLQGLVKKQSLATKSPPCQRRRCWKLVLGCLLLIASPVKAYLGGFEDNDGYTNDYFSSTGPFGIGAGNYLVNLYNAGAYGTASGGPGGTPQHITTNSGLWQQLDPNAMGGNRYMIAHAQVGAEVAYAGDAMLGMRNQGTSATTLDLRYFMDSRDYNGLVPTNPLISLVNWTLRLCPDTPGVGTDPQTDAFYWTFRDSNLDAGLELGWNDTNTVIYRLPGASAWTVTSFTLDHLNYDEMNLTMNIASHTWSLSFFDQSALSNVQVVTNSALSSSMDNWTTTDWRLEYNQSKSYFDNSTFSVVPEPGSWLMLGALGIAFLGRRKRFAEQC